MSETTILIVDESRSPIETNSANKALLDEASAAQKWLHAKKARPIWAKWLGLSGWRGEIADY